MSNTAAICKHIKANGTICQVLAMRNQDFCYYHQRDRQRRNIVHRGLDNRRYCFANPKSELAQGVNLEGFDDDSAAILAQLDLPPLEDATSIQVAISNLIRMVATQQISTERARTLGYFLQLAIMNQPNVKTEDLRASFRDVIKAASDPEPISRDFPDFKAIGAALSSPKTISREERNPQPEIKPLQAG